MKRFEMTETQREWIAELLNAEAEEHACAASNEHIWAMGSDTPEDAEQHEQYAEENRQYALMLREMKVKLQGEDTSCIPQSHYTKGTRPITEGDFYLDENDNPWSCDGWNHYDLIANCNVDEIFGTNVETSENDDFLTISASVSSDLRQIQPVLQVLLQKADGFYGELLYGMSEPEMKVIHSLIARYEASRLLKTAKSPYLEFDGYEVTEYIPTQKWNMILAAMNYDYSDAYDTIDPELLCAALGEIRRTFPDGRTMRIKPCYLTECRIVDLEVSLFDYDGKKLTDYMAEYNREEKGFLYYDGPTISSINPVFIMSAENLPHTYTLRIVQEA